MISKAEAVQLSAYAQTMLDKACGPHRSIKAAQAELDEATTAFNAYVVSLIEPEGGTDRDQQS